jgi:hypothetical protein
MEERVVMARGIENEGPGVIRPESDPATATTGSRNPSAQGNGGSVSVARLVDIVVVLGALLTGAAGLASIFAPQVFLAAVGVSGEPITAGTEIFARYMGARNVALAVMLLILVAVRSRRVLAGLVVTTALANALDCALDLVAQRWPAAPGPFLFAVLYLAAAAWLFRQDRKKPATE